MELQQQWCRKGLTGKEHLVFGTTVAADQPDCRLIPATGRLNIGDLNHGVHFHCHHQTVVAVRRDGEAFEVPDAGYGEVSEHR